MPGYIYKMLKMPGYIHKMLKMPGSIHMIDIYNTMVWVMVMVKIKF